MDAMMEMNADINNYLFSDFPSLALSSHPNPRKKRLRTVNKPDSSSSSAATPLACTECGKSFPSWKALFGHMRCHPERHWRGINPPPTFRRSTEEDHEVAACLLMLANGHPTPDFSFSDQNAADVAFECSSCKRVFGSHQALGGHRASHKNVKGCYAINKNGEGCCSGEMKDNNYNNGHKCGICFRVFSSGQALGGHMRCHWEKEEEPSYNYKVCEFDLNLAAPPPLLQEDDDASSFPYGPALELRLGF